MNKQSWKTLQKVRVESEKGKIERELGENVTYFYLVAI